MKAPLRRALVGGAAAALLAAPSAAADAEKIARTPRAVAGDAARTPRAAATVMPPMTLPGDAVAASVPAARGTWIVGARPGAAAREVARRFGARHIGPAGTGGYVLAPARARAFAAALERRGLLVYAQPDTLAEPHQAVPKDPLAVPPDAWRDVVADPARTPPPVDPSSPLIALVDAQLDLTHGEWQGGNVGAIQQFPVTNSHGTATASVAAAPVNGIGIVGVWPGARALNVPLPEEIPCSTSAEQIQTAIEQEASVINMSYGSRGLCFPEYVALQFAVARGIVPVAAAGNEFAEGNPLEFPASLPHVLTVAAVGPDLQSSFFSNTSAAIDLAAPGEEIMTAVPPGLDGDGNPDGYERQSGTSFAAPMVSAAVAWVTAARPELSADQVNQAVRLSAQDVGREGWEPDTGFGVLSVGSALSIPPMPRDPAEPNDDIVWVDGRAFSRPDRLLFKGGRAVRIIAILDAFEDPADVYRIRLRPHSRKRITANPTGSDDVALAVYKKSASRLSSKPLKKSARRGRRTERITLRNRSRRARVFYVAVRVQPGVRDLDATYALRVG